MQTPFFSSATFWAKQIIVSLRLIKKVPHSIGKGKPARACEQHSDAEPQLRGRKLYNVSFWINEAKHKKKEDELGLAG